MPGWWAGPRFQNQLTDYALPHYSRHNTDYIWRVFLCFKFCVKNVTNIFLRFFLKILLEYLILWAQDESVSSRPHVAEANFIQVCSSGVLTFIFFSLYKERFIFAPSLYPPWVPVTLISTSSHPHCLMNDYSFMTKLKHLLF